MQPSIHLTIHSMTLRPQIDHQRFRLVRQISSVIRPILIIWIDEGELKGPDESGEGEAGFGEECPGGFIRGQLSLFLVGDR